MSPPLAIEKSQIDEDHRHHPPKTIKAVA